MAPRKRFKTREAAASPSGVAAEKPLLMLADKKSRTKETIVHNSKTSHISLESMDEGGKQQREGSGEKEEEDRSGSARDDGVMDLVQCGLCNDAEPKDLFITACGHQFCRSCIVHHVLELTSNITTTSIFVKELMWIFCPYPSCDKQLQQHDLINLVGLSSVRYYQDWMVKYLDILYKPLLSGASSMVCLSAKCDQQIASAMLADKLSDLSADKVKHALELRGLNTQNFTKRSSINFLLSGIGTSTKQTDPVWVCSTCEASWCGVCGIQVPLHPLQRKSYFHSHLCCDGQKKYSIYRAIAKLKDAFYFYMSNAESFGKKLATRTPKSLVNTIWADGTGFGGGRAETSSFTASTQRAAKKAELYFDGQVEDAMEILIEILFQSEEAKNAGNVCSLNSASCALINWDGTLRQVLCHLATNDSMLDISERRNVYLKMAALIKVLMSYSELIPLLCCEITTGIRVGTENTKSSSLMKKLGNIYKQATIMLHNMEAESSNSTPDMDITLAKELARELCSCYEALAEKAKTLKTSLLEPMQPIASSSSSEPNSELLKSMTLMNHKYKETLEPLQFKLVSMIDSDGNYKHSYGKCMVGSSTCIDKGGVHNHQRLLHISKEIASLSTTLPLEWESSIHVRVDQERMDVLKALIVGPSGTPYQNGIFIFDIFLPPDYPQLPPKVKFLTTGGGMVRFNPNLYESGDVCLSLLGTWDGPGWISGKSTILQVLVSIQSLIFVKDPFYNEPGLEYQHRRTLAAENENRHHRKNTLSYAILAALRKPDSFFEEVIFEHFRHKKLELEVQCEEWIASASKEYKGDMGFVTAQIKAELKILLS